MQPLLHLICIFIIYWSSGQAWDLADFIPVFCQNKNKTGHSLGQSNVKEGHSSSSTRTDTNQLQECLHVHSSLRGNNTGNGSKLGNMQLQTCQMSQVNNNDIYMDNSDQKLINADSFHLQGNKNGNGTKLGHRSAPDVNIDSLTSSSLQLSTTPFSDPTPGNKLTNADSIHLQGNKNKNGTKLGHRSTSYDTIGTLSSTPSQSSAYSSSDPTSGDILRHTNKRIRQIPPDVYGARYQSLDYKNCLYQNDKHFGFIPLNDLTVYTGQEVIWERVPDGLVCLTSCI